MTGNKAQQYLHRARMFRDRQDRQLDLYATILGLPPPPGTVAITNERMRVRLAIFWAKTRMGWETSVDEHRGKPGYPKFYRPYP